VPTTRERNVRRLLSSIATKMLTGKSLEDYANERLVEIYEKNHIFSANLKSYLADPSPTHPYLKERTYIGTARMNSEAVGLIISYDEGCGYTHGYVVPINRIKVVRGKYYDYKINPLHYREFSTYFVYEVCGGYSSTLIDSVGNNFDEPEPNDDLHPKSTPEQEITTNPNRTRSYGEYEVEKRYNDEKLLKQYPGLYSNTGVASSKDGSTTNSDQFLKDFQEKEGQRLALLAEKRALKMNDKTQDLDPNATPRPEK
jgi:hypothetical protein